MAQVGLISQWKLVFGWLRPTNLKMLIFGALITIKRSFLISIKFAAFPGLFFAAILVPFYAISAIWLKITPTALLMSGLYISGPYHDRIIRVLPIFLGQPTVLLLKFLLFFASYIIPILVIRASTERKDLQYLKTYSLPALMLWPLLLVINLLLSPALNALALQFVSVAQFWTYSAIVRIIEYLIVSWILAFRLNIGFFFFDAVLTHGIPMALWVSIKNSCKAAVYFLPILLIPWPAFMALVINSTIWLISWPMRFLPAVDLNVGMLVESGGPIVQRLTLSLAPFIAIVYTSIFSLLAFSFYGAVFLKIKHEAEWLFTGRSLPKS